MKVRVEIEMTPEEAKSMMTPDYANPDALKLMTAVHSAWWDQAIKMMNPKEK